MIRLLIFLLIAGLLPACAKTKPGSAEEPVVPDPEPVSYKYESENAYSLNVVYFIPKGIQIPTDYHRRISEILIDAKTFIDQEMVRNGYSAKRLGLMQDQIRKRVQLIVINGASGGNAYPYEGGANPVISEINNHRAAHPSLYNGDHYLVILPATTYDSNGEPGGVPFYGFGKYCFALDYSDQDLKWLGKQGVLADRATKWIGGMIHELGHGLNLPHNCQKQSEEPVLGMALMWAGNSTWGKSKTFLTEADCAVLQVNQVFSKDKNSFYSSVNAGVQRITAVYDKIEKTIVVNGRFKTDGTVTDILIFNDPNVDNEGVGVNRDYNAVAWRSKPINNDSFSVTMPLADFKHLNDYPYEMKLKLVHSNGTVHENIYSYRMVNGEPDLSFSTRDEIDKSGWKISSVSSEEKTAENGSAGNLLDGDPQTYWHSRWSTAAATFPHEIIVDAGQSVEASGLSIIQRQSLNRAVKGFDFYTSGDGQIFTLLLSHSLANSNGPQYVDFSGKLKFRYFKLVATSSWDGEPFAALAELGLY